MKKEIVEGYLYEVTKSLSRRERKEVYEKLESEIYEKIELRKAHNIETREEVMEVLEEYGNPADVAAKYTSKDKRALVPQPHYTHYSRNKMIAFIVSLFTLAGLNIFGYLFIKDFSLGIDPVDSVIKIVTTVATILLIIYISYTLAFSWVSGSRLTNWNRFTKNLKPEPSKASKISAIETSFQVIISSILLVVFGFGTEILNLNNQAINIGYDYFLPLIIPVVLVYFFNILNLAYKEIDRKYTFSVLFSTIVSNLSIIGLAFIFFVQNDVVSKNFKSWLGSLLPSNDLMLSFVNNFGLVIFFTIVLFAAIDLITTTMGYHSTSKDSVEGIYKANQEAKENEDMFVTTDDFKDDSYHNMSDTPMEGIPEENTNPNLDSNDDIVIVDEPKYEEVVVTEVEEEPILVDKDNKIIEEDINLSDTRVIPREEIKENLNNKRILDGDDVIEDEVIIVENKDSQIPEENSTIIVEETPKNDNNENI